MLESLANCFRQALYDIFAIKNIKDPEKALYKFIGMRGGEECWRTMNKGCLSIFGVFEEVPPRLIVGRVMN
jgi:hypothetical protein